MDKRLQKIIAFTLALLPIAIYAQVPSETLHIRLPLWAELDAYPELKEAQNTSAPVFDYPIRRLKETGPFIIEGMVYGWSFTYTPSDKLRKVAEYFDFKEIQPLGKDIQRITYLSPWITDNKVNSWVEFTRTPQMLRNYYLWTTIDHPKIHGRGTGKINRGFDGITDAVQEAAKDAIRSYYRQRLKNKPKEITGSLLLKNLPEFGINAGEYTVELDFFLESGRILEYKMY